MSEFEDFKNSLEKLGDQARETAMMGMNIAKEQLESMVQNPQLAGQVEEFRDNLTNVVKQVEAKTEELSQMVQSYIGMMRQQQQAPKTEEKKD